MDSGSRSIPAVDPRRVRRCFERVSRTYDAAAVLQTEVRDSLLQRLTLTTLSPQMILDVGAGTGHASKVLKRRYPRARVIAVDSACAMLQQSRRQQSFWRRFDRLCADADRLPFADASVDLIFCNLVLCWCDADVVLQEFRRVLAPQGLLSLTSFGPDTLKELRSAWAAVDAYEHVNRFVDMHDLGDALVRAGFAAPVLDVDTYTLNYLDITTLIKDLRDAGTHNLGSDRPRGLTGRGKWHLLRSAYESYRRDGRLPASYEVVFAHAWAPLAASVGRASGESHVTLEELKAHLSKYRGGAGGQQR